MTTAQNAALRPAEPDPDLIADLEACRNDRELADLIGHPTPHWPPNTAQPGPHPRRAC